MTRAERLEQTEARALARLAVEQRRLAQVQAARREEARKALTKRRLLVGEMVLDTPLASLDDQVLQGLFQVLAALVAVPDPVALLEGLLSDVGGPPGTSVHGCAHPTDGVPPAVSLGRECDRTISQR